MASTSTAAMGPAAGDFRVPGRRDLVAIKLEFEGRGWELALTALWILSVSTTLPIFGPVRYLVVLGFLGAIFYHYRQVLPYFVKYWFLFLFPVWAMMSALWAPSFASALRFGVQQSLLIMTLIYIAVRMSPHQIIKAMFYAFVVVGMFAFKDIGNIGSHSMPDGFAEKNMLASRMFFLFVTSLYVIYTERANLIEKALAITCVPLAFYVIILAESATSLVLSILAFVFMLVIGTVWRAVTRVQALPALMMIAAAGLAALGVLIAFSLFAEGPVGAFLNAVGKDATLTGRTELWDAAKGVIAERPLLGLGAEGFWVPYRGDAQTLLEYFYKDQFTKFSFHNSYLEISVHFGLIGLASFLVGLAYLVQRIGVNWFRKQDMATSFFLLIGLLVMARSMTESDFYNIFEINKMSLILGGLSGMSYRTVLAPKGMRIPT